MILRALSLLACLALEAAAVNAWLASPGTGVSFSLAWLLHMSAALWFGILAGAAFHREGDPVGRILFGGMLFLFCALVPVAGFIASILILGMLRRRKSSPPLEDRFSADSPLDRLRASPFHHPADLDQKPLVTALKTEPLDEIRRLVLGLGQLDDRRATAILKHLMNHRDHRIQLFAKGALSDRVELLEARLDTLAGNTGNRPSTVNRIATARIFLELVERELLPRSEREHGCLRGIEACDEGLADAPASVSLLLLKARFLLDLGRADAAHAVLQQLEKASAPPEELAALRLQLLHLQAPLRELAAAFQKCDPLPGDIGESQRFWAAPPATCADVIPASN